MLAELYQGWPVKPGTLLANHWMGWMIILFHIFSNVDEIMCNSFQFRNVACLEVKSQQLTRLSLSLYFLNLLIFYNLLKKRVRYIFFRRPNCCLFISDNIENTQNIKNIPFDIICRPTYISNIVLSSGLTQITWCIETMYSMYFKQNSFQGHYSCRMVLCCWLCQGWWKEFCLRNM